MCFFYHGLKLLIKIQIENKNQDEEDELQAKNTKILQ